LWKKSHGKIPTRNEGELKFHQWQKPIQDLILEFDRERLLEKNTSGGTMITKRHQELVWASDGHLEGEALNDATSSIGVLEVWTDRAK
jgi:hypothetical protein